MDKIITRQPSLSVIITTYKDTCNAVYKFIADEIFSIDFFSTNSTIKITKSYGAKFYYNISVYDYWKKLTLAFIGKMDKHFIALWGHGHIKFWSLNILGEIIA
jgi:hypothetical protein